MTYTTIAQIKALTGPLPDNFFYTTDKNQEREWVYDPTDTSSLNNNGTILVTADGKRIKRIPGSKMVSIKWFGAVGNGTADDTNPIQAAYDFCKATNSILYLPAGSYRVTGLQFNGRVNVVGANTKEVYIRPLNDNVTIVNHVDSQDRTGTDTEYTSRLSNFTIHASGKNGIIGLRTYLTLATCFSQITIVDCDKYGLLAEGTQYSVFDQVVCEFNNIGIRLLDDVSYGTNPSAGGGVSNDFRSCTTRGNTIGVMLGRPSNPYPFNLTRFTNLISKANKYTALYAINTGVSLISELGAEANTYSPVASVTITNPGAGYETVPTITISGGGPTTPATAVANLYDQYTVTETLGNINGDPLTITSVIKRSAVHAETSNLNFVNYNHSQRNAQVYALNYSSLFIDGMQGAVIYTTADETSSIVVNNGRGGNGSVLVNTEVRQFNTPNFYAQTSVITAARYVVNNSFLNETQQSKVPEFIAGSTNTV